MNYRHAYHAGNFADVLKHVVLVRVMLRLAAKPAPFRVIDTHAGDGLYDLSGEASEKTGEWRAGIGRFDAEPLDDAGESLVAPFRKILAELRAEHGAAAYPGSPEIARRLVRAGDRVIAIEREERTFRSLRRALGRDPRAKAILLDGWTGLLAYVPPKERRGLVLIDPPYEAPEEFHVVARHLAEAMRKWPTGVYAIWYPVTDRGLVERFVRRVSETVAGDMLRAELAIRADPDGKGLAACGMLVVNPPWKLEEDLRVLLPALAGRLAPDGQGPWTLDRLPAAAAGERLGTKARA